MLGISKKSFKNELPFWANEEDMLQILEKYPLNRREKDEYTVRLIEKLLTRIKVLEENTDDLIAEEK